MNIDRELLAHIAGLARLELSEQESERMLADLEQILAHVAEIEALDLADVSPTSLGRSESAAALPLREDEAAPSLPQREIAALAPRWREGHFLVPPVLGEDSDEHRA